MINLHRATHKNNTVPVRMQVYSFSPVMGHPYEPLPAAPQQMMDIAYAGLFDEACSDIGAGEFHDELNIALRVGACDMWRVQPDGDIKDHLFCLYPREYPSSDPLTVSLVLRPGMSRAQIHGYLDWMELLCDKQFNVEWLTLGADHPDRLRSSILHNLPCVVTLSNIFHHQAGGLLGLISESKLNRLIGFNRVSADLAYYLIQGKPRFFGDRG